LKKEEVMSEGINDGIREILQQEEGNMQPNKSGIDQKLKRKRIYIKNS